VRLYRGAGFQTNNSWVSFAEGLYSSYHRLRFFIRRRWLRDQSRSRLHQEKRTMAQDGHRDNRLTYPIRQGSNAWHWAVLSGERVLGSGIARTSAEARTAAALLGTMFPAAGEGMHGVAPFGAHEHAVTRDGSRQR
jgi:hypothetical protein